MLGPDVDAWTEETDLMVIRQLEGQDLLFQWVFHRLVSLFHKVLGKRLKVNRADAPS